MWAETTQMRTVGTVVVVVGPSQFWQILLSNPISRKQGLLSHCRFGWNGFPIYMRYSCNGRWSRSYPTSSPGCYRCSRHPVPHLSHILWCVFLGFVLVFCVAGVIMGVCLCRVDARAAIIYVPSAWGNSGQGLHERRSGRLHDYVEHWQNCCPSVTHAWRPLLMFRKVGYWWQFNHGKPGRQKLSVLGFHSGLCLGGIHVQIQFHAHHRLTENQVGSSGVVCFDGG